MRFVSSPCRCLLVAACFAFLAASVSKGQITNVTDDQATPIPGVGHDYTKMLGETVNPANGSVSIRIQVPTPPGRRLTLPFSFAYDSNGAQHLEDDGVGGEWWNTNFSYLAQNGWSYSVPMLEQTYLLLKNTATQRNTCPATTANIFHDASGGRNALRLSQNGTPTIQGCTGYNSQLSGGNDYFLANVSSAVFPGPVAVANADGTVYQFPNPSAHQTNFDTTYTDYASLPSVVEDRNGNQITVTDSGNGAFAYTDTLGRAAISSSGFGATGNTVAVSGLTSPYTITWGNEASSFPAPNVSVIL